jgi:hypothetical protein
MIPEVQSDLGRTVRQSKGARKEQVVGKGE